MLNLICGISGSGKTSTIRKMIEQDVLADRRCYLIIPEQQAYISEKELTESLPKNAGLFFEVANFSRLAEDVTRTFGGVSAPLPDRGTKAVLMWETLRRLSPALECYRLAGTDNGLSALMLSAISELRNNGLESDVLENAAKALPDSSPLSKKLRDLALIEAGFEACAEESFGGDEIDRLIALSETLKTHSFFENSHIYIDSFTSFTDPEYRVISELLKQADMLTVSLCTDRAQTKRVHFETVSETFSRLRRIADKADVLVRETILQPTTGKKPEILSFVSENLWNFSLSKSDIPNFSPEEKEAVRLGSATNIYEESEWVAQQIQKLVRQGIFYGDIALIVRNLDTYRGVLDAALERHEIPFFLSENTDLSTKPLSRLILSALRIICRNYRQNDVITLLKTGLTDASFRDISLFEDYCQVWHINGTRFLDDVWNMNPDGLTTKISDRGAEILSAANRVKEILTAPLKHLYADLSSSEKLSDRCRAVYEYLRRLNISEKLTSFAKKELSLGSVRQASESLRLYDVAIDTLTGLSTLLPDAEVTVEEFISLLTLLFANSDFGSVPNLHDCVTIGSADTLRVENIQVSFLLGLCEGEFPKAISNEGILSEQEKDTLENLGLVIHTRERQLSSEELMFVYRAISKPQKSIFLSYPLMRPEGSNCTPSLAINRIKYLLGYVEIPKVSLITTRFSLEKAEKCKDILKNGDVEYHLPPAPGGVNLRLSQSSVREFVLCPYQYFIHHRLKLRQKMDSNLKAADEGSFLHFVFQQFLRSALGKDGLIHIPAPEEIETLADEIINNYLSTVCPLPPELMDARLLHLFRRLRILALLMLREILSEISVSQFRPALFEQTIGGDKNALPPVVLSLPDGSTVTLTGTVDRIDFYDSPEDGKTYLRIIDYKTGQHKFSPEDVKSGKDIQLVLYLIAALGSDPKRLAPGSAQFLYGYAENGVQKFKREGILLDSDTIRNAIDGTGKDEFYKALTRESETIINELMEEMKTTVQTVAGLILSGEAKKTPSEDACRFCPVRENCTSAILPRK